MGKYKLIGWKSLFYEQNLLNDLQLYEFRLYYICKHHLSGSQDRTTGGFSFFKFKKWTITNQDNL